MDAGNKKEPGHSRTDTARKIVVAVLVVLCITLLAAVVYLLKEKKTAPAADQITDWDTGIEEYRQSQRQPVPDEGHPLS